MAFKDSCATVPCSFTLEDNLKPYLLPQCQPIWRQDHKDGPPVPDLTEQSTGVMSATFRGNLTEYNCTTTFYNVHDGSYYLRLECPNPLKWTFAGKPVTIQTKGKCNVYLSEPTMYHKSYCGWNYVDHLLCLGLHSNRSELIWYPGDFPALRLTPPKEQVVEGNPVELRCSAPSPCDTHPTNVMWTPTLGLSTQLQQDNVVTSTLTFNASLHHHGSNVSCTATYFMSPDKTMTSTSSYQLSILCELMLYLFNENNIFVSFIRDQDRRQCSTLINFWWDMSWR